MDKNKLADILKETYKFNVPNKNNQRQVTFQKEEEEITFEDEEVNAHTNEDKNPSDNAIEEDEEEEDEDYNSINKEDKSLKADEEEEDIPSIHQTKQVRVPNPRYQHLQATRGHTK